VGPLALPFGDGDLPHLLVRVPGWDPEPSVKCHARPARTALLSRRFLSATEFVVRACVRACVFLCFLVFRATSSPHSAPISAWFRTKKRIEAKLSELPAAYRFYHPTKQL
jgi:hypothetical protein